MTAVLSRLIVTTLLLNVDVRPVPPNIDKSDSVSEIKLLSDAVDTLIEIDSPPVIPST